MSSLQSCPLEVLTLISGFLDKSDLICLSQTNTAFYHICVPQLWADLAIAKLSSQQQLLHHQFPVELSTLASSSIRSITIPVANLTPLNLQHFITSLLHLDLPRLGSINVSFCEDESPRAATFNNNNIVYAGDFQLGCDSFFSQSHGSFDSTCSDDLPGDAYINTNKNTVIGNNNHCRINRNSIGSSIDINNNISIGSSNSSEDYTYNLVNALFTRLSIFLTSHPNVRLCIDSTSIHSLYKTILSSTTTEAIQFKHLINSLTVETLQTASNHRKLVSVLQNLTSLEHLSITSAEEAEFCDNDEEDEEDHNESDVEGMEMYEINTLIYTSAIAHMGNLKSLAINSTSLLEAFLPKAIPTSVTSLELESNYTNFNSSCPASFSSSFSTGDSLRVVGTAAIFNTFWFQFLSHNFSHLTSLKIGLWAPDLFNYGITQPHHQPSFYIPQPDISLTAFPNATTSALAITTGTNNNMKRLGNLRNLHIEGDFMPPGLDTVLFESNPNLEIVMVPIIYEQGAQALADTCCHSLKHLTVSGNFEQNSGNVCQGDNEENVCGGSNSTVYAPQPCFIEKPGALSLLSKCYCLDTLELSVVANTLSSADMLQFLRNKRLYSQHKNSHDLYQQKRPLKVIIEQTDYDLPYYREIISEEEYDDYGGFSMLPLDWIKERMPAYERLRTRFVPASRDNSINNSNTDVDNTCSIEKFVRPIDEDPSSRDDPKYKEYYEQAPFVRYNCVFVLDTEAFERSTEFC